jgi:hypothetical protein
MEELNQISRQGMEDGGTSQVEALASQRMSPQEAVEGAKSSMPSWLSGFFEEDKQEQDYDNEALEPRQEAPEPKEKHKWELKEMSPELVEHIKLREGGLDKETNQYLVYRDNVRTEKAPKGYLTAGIGHKLVGKEVEKYKEGTPVPVEQVNKWFAEDTLRSRKDALKQAKALDLPSLEEALISVNFQMGAGWKSKFKLAWKALETHDFADAIYEITHGSSGGESLWLKQSPTRVEDFVTAIQQTQQIEEGGEDV